MGWLVVVTRKMNTAKRERREESISKCSREAPETRGERCNEAYRVRGMKNEK